MEIRHRVFLDAGGTHGGEDGDGDGMRGDEGEGSLKREKRRCTSPAA